MSDAFDRQAAIAALLDALPGVKATNDPKKVVSQLPCILVGPPTLDFPTLCGTYALSWELVALAPRGSALQGVKQMLELVELVSAALPVSLARPTAYALVEGQDPYPAYVMTMED